MGPSDHRARLFPLACPLARPLVCNCPHQPNWTRRQKEDPTPTQSPFAERSPIFSNPSRHSRPPPRRAPPRPPPLHPLLLPPRSLTPPRAAASSSSLVLPRRGSGATGGADDAALHRHSSRCLSSWESPP
jgi:hypothetical protein